MVARAATSSTDVIFYSTSPGAVIWRPSTTLGAVIWRWVGVPRWSRERRRAATSRTVPYRTVPYRSVPYLSMPCRTCLTSDPPTDLLTY